MDAAQLISKAKVNLILDHPFFATLLLAMPLIERAETATMETDGETVWFNPQWTAKHTLPEITFVLAHETLHGVFGHTLRRGAKTPNRWNIATDYVINDLLVAEKVGTMPKGALFNSQLVAQGGGTAEGVYALLPEDSEGKAPGTKGGALDGLVQPSQDKSVLSQKESEMRVKVVQARNAAKMHGKLSGGIDRLVKELVRTETDWRSVLRRFLSERAKTDLSYARPKRRFLAEDIYLPSLVGEKLGAIEVAIDCSGSVSPAMLDMFCAEIRAIAQDTMPSEIRITYFDHTVLKRETFGPDDTITLKPVGGGGTAFSPVFKTVNADETPPVAVVVLTDLMCNDFGPAPEYPVLWASTDRNHNAVPFGEITYLKEVN